MMLEHLTCDSAENSIGSMQAALSRRSFLKVSGAATGGLLISIKLPAQTRQAEAADAERFAPNAFIRIDRQGAVTLVMPIVEMGQGTYTSLAMLLAEELEVGLDQVKLEHAPPNDALYANPILHIQLTGMSSSIRAFWTPLRQAGAVARTLLIAAAAKQWGVDPAVCR
ncbi:MAG TPA: molybdopterin cofactor-binding domain-containing protein, partial [Xanthobacteraceae bacterium]|nr:molybdopterin cofactor-binding domain-containing protein [Xanthobacteraceae bacterium]